MTAAGLVEHYFRHEYGRITAALARRFGYGRLELVEDAVQSALALALTSWGLRGVPPEPGAWLHRAARNLVIDALRRERALGGILAKEDASDAAETEPARLSDEIEDDELRMLFVCCDPAVPHESRVVLALKVLCGFSVPEIANALFMTDANVHKRIARARERLREVGLETERAAAEMEARLGDVQLVLYLLLGEGYHASHSDRLVRRDLCEEALRLCSILARNPRFDTPATRALFALMCFHLARIETRVDGDGGQLPLEEQDRARWDRELIQVGFQWLARSAEGSELTRYHAEAGIAAEHCIAPSFQDTRWDKIAELYALLERVAPSPLNQLNRAIAIGQIEGPRAGLALIANDPPLALRGYYLWHAVVGELHRGAGERAIAADHLRKALAGAPTSAERALLERRLRACAPP